MTATGVTGRSPALPGRLARSLRGAGLSGAALAGAGAAGALVSLRAAYPRPPRADRVTARVTAKSIEYPTGHLHLAGAAWPWRPTTLLALTVAAAIGAGFLPAAAAWRHRP